MPINHDLGDLPSKPAPSGGWKPDESPIFGPIVIEAMMNEAGVREAKTREYIRPSDAMKCARQLSFAANGAPSPPMDPSGWWVTGLGTIIHREWQRHILEHFGAEHVTIEDDIAETVSVRGHDVPVNAFIDVRIHTPELHLVTDLKSVGGFAYKMAVGERGEAQGPKREHLIQAGIGALVRGADKVSVTYISKDSISKAIAARKGFDQWQVFTAEWTVDLDDIRTEVEDEMLRMWAINRLWHDDGLLAKRMVPGIPVEISAPKDGSWQETEEVDGKTVLIDRGNYWGCGYCSYQQLCIAAGPGRVPMPEGDSHA